MVHCFFSKLGKVNIDNNKKNFPSFIDSLFIVHKTNMVRFSLEMLVCYLSPPFCVWVYFDRCYKLKYIHNYGEKNAFSFSQSDKFVPTVEELRKRVMTRRH